MSTWSSPPCDASSQPLNLPALIAYLGMGLMFAGRGPAIPQPLGIIWMLAGSFGLTAAMSLEPIHLRRVAAILLEEERSYAALQKQAISRLNRILRTVDGKPTAIIPADDTEPRRG